MAQRAYTRARARGMVERACRRSGGSLTQPAAPAPTPPPPPAPTPPARQEQAAPASSGGSSNGGSSNGGSSNGGSSDGGGSSNRGSSNRGSSTSGTTSPLRDSYTSTVTCHDGSITRGLGSSRDAALADATAKCPLVEATVTCPDGSQFTRSSRISQADARTKARRLCPASEPEDDGVSGDTIQRPYSATVTCSDGTRSTASSKTSHADAEDKARQRCSSPTAPEPPDTDSESSESSGSSSRSSVLLPYRARIRCADGSWKHGSSAFSRDAAVTLARAQCPVYTATVTCSDGSLRRAASRVSNSDAASSARAQCPREYTWSFTCESEHLSPREVTGRSTVSVADAEREARSACDVAIGNVPDPDPDDSLPSDDSLAKQAHEAQEANQRSRGRGGSRGGGGGGIPMSAFTECPGEVGPACPDD